MAISNFNEKSKTDFNSQKKTYARPLNLGVAAEIAYGPIVFSGMWLNADLPTRTFFQDNVKSSLMTIDGGLGWAVRYSDSFKGLYGIVFRMEKFSTANDNEVIVPSKSMQGLIRARTSYTLPWMILGNRDGQGGFGVDVGTVSLDLLGSFWGKVTDTHATYKRGSSGRILTYAARLEYVFATHSDSFWFSGWFTGVWGEIYFGTLSFKGTPSPSTFQSGTKASPFGTSFGMIFGRSHVF